VTEAAEAREPARRVRDEPLDVEKVAANLPFVVRTLAGMSALAIAANIGGILVVAFVQRSINASAKPHQLAVVLVTSAIIAGAAVLIGIPAGALVQRRTMRWLLRGDEPTDDDARRAMRLPLDIAIVSIALWTLGSIVVGTAAAVVGVDARSVLGISAGIVLSGLGAAGLTYLLLARVNRPVALLALEARPPQTAPLFGLQWRLVFNWALTTATPIVGLVLVLTTPPGKTNIVSTGIVVALTGLALSGVAISLSARAIGDSLRGIVTALHRVGEGDLEVKVAVDDAGEIGLVQNGFNDMVSGLRERERIQDLFGRHVGSAVAAEAISGGVTMSGESREVVALFVDITGSTKLTREMAPSAFVDMLNRFFTVVVEEVETNNGLLNKFEGDAALCVFGAPAELDDPATAALRTARGIRDRVARTGELEVGIGVALGPAIAGQIGTASRLEYTVIGDAVNEAARLTEQAKRTEGRVLASEATVESCTPDEREHWVKGRSLRLRGREAPTHTYRTVPPVDGDTTSFARRLGGMAKAVHHLPSNIAGRESAEAERPAQRPG